MNNLDKAMDLLWDSLRIIWKRSDSSDTFEESCEKELKIYFDAIAEIDYVKSQNAKYKSIDKLCEAARNCE